jgi:hypothetical protein
MRYAILNSLLRLKPGLLILLLCCTLPGTVTASDWHTPAQQLARKIVAVTGPGAVAVTFENRSSLSKKDFDAICGALRVELALLGVRPMAPEQAAASVAISLSENPRLSLWVAEIHQGTAEPAVVMVSTPRDAEPGLAHEVLPMSLRKIPLWAQEDRILDMAVLEEDGAPKHIAVLDATKVAIYRQKNGKWQLEQSLAIAHSRPWPRDLRGRLILAKDHLFDIYLPGAFCRTTTGVPLALNCRESDDPWPLTSLSGVQTLGGFYAASRNFFTGALTPGVGKLTNVGKFYAAAALPRGSYALWLFAGTDGQVHLVDGITEQPVKLNWGSDLVSVKTACGSGWQVLATADDADKEPDSVRAYEIADREPMPVSAPLDFSGEVTALWTEARGDSAIAVVRNRETGEYEAFRLAVACGQ